MQKQLLWYSSYINECKKGTRVSSSQLWNHNSLISSSLAKDKFRDFLKFYYSTVATIRDISNNSHILFILPVLQKSFHSIHRKLVKTDMLPKTKHKIIYKNLCGAKTNGAPSEMLAQITSKFVTSYLVRSKWFELDKGNKNKCTASSHRFKTTGYLKIIVSWTDLANSAQAQLWQFQHYDTSQFQHCGTSGFQHYGTSTFQHYDT